MFKKKKKQKFTRKIRIEIKNFVNVSRDIIFKKDIYN